MPRKRTFFLQILQIVTRPPVLKSIFINFFVKVLRYAILASTTLTTSQRTLRSAATINIDGDLFKEAPNGGSLSKIDPIIEMTSTYFMEEIVPYVV